MPNFGNKIPLARQVAISLKQKIRKGVYRAGDALPSVRKLGDEFGVSINVIYRALRELEAHGVVRTHHGKGTVVQDDDPARSAAIMFAFIQPFSDGMIFEQQVLHDVEQGFGQRNNFVVVRSSQGCAERERELVEHLMGNGIQGILLWPVPNDPNGSFFEKLAQQVPIVQVDRLMKDCQLPGVVFDTYTAGQQISQAMLATRQCQRLLALIDDLEISPYDDLIRGLHDGAVAIERRDAVTVTKMPLTGYIRECNAGDYSRIDALGCDIEALVEAGGYDALLSPHEDILDYALFQTDSIGRLRHLQLATISGVGPNYRSRQYNEFAVVKWCAAFPQLIAQAAEMLQQAVLTRKRSDEVIRLPVVGGLKFEV